MPEEFTQFTLALPYNDIGALEQAFEKFKHQIACVIVEPVVGNMGCVPPARGYLEALRAITARDKALLIFDEVMTGFRLAFGGAQELYGIQPDLTTMGKIIGGGSARGRLWRAERNHGPGRPSWPGVSGWNAFGKSAGDGCWVRDAGYLRDHKDIYARLDKLAGEVVAGVAAAAKDAGVTMCHNRVGLDVHLVLRARDR